MIQIIKAKSYVRWLAFSLVIVLLSGCYPWQIHAQDTIAVAKQVIIVKNEQGEPIKDAVFQITNEKNEVLETCTSDINGRAEIIKVIDGIYQLNQLNTQIGYEVIKEQSIEIKTENPIKEEIIINALILDESISNGDNTVVPEENIIEKTQPDSTESTQDNLATNENIVTEEPAVITTETSIAASAVLGNFTTTSTPVSGNPTQFTITTVGCAGKTGIGYVFFPTWSENKGQDDLIWYQGTLGRNGEYSITVDSKDHGFETGKYNVHTYIYGLKGEVIGTAINTYSQSTPSPNLTVSAVTNNSYKITVTGVSNPEGVSGVFFPTWSEANGQDDIRWETGAYIGNDTWEVTINLKDYKQTYDTFMSHAYVIDQTGKMSLLNIIEKTIENPLKDITMKIIRNPENTTQFTVSTVGYAGKTGIGNVLLPTWSEKNGQDDIQWHQGTLGSNGEYSVTIDNKDHGFETGTYNIHTYIYGLRNEVLSIYANTFNQPQPSPAIKVGEVMNNSYKVSITGVSNPDGIRSIAFPTWSAFNGQDDIRWESGTYVGNDTWETTINLNDYNRSYDTFISHAYITDKNGNVKFSGATQKIINNPFDTQPLKIAVNKDRDVAQFTISTTNCSGKPGVTGVSFPVWTSRNGQDDLEWVSGTLGSNGEYSANVDIEYHGFETGPYSIHAYLYGNKGETIGFTNNFFTLDTANPTIAYDKAVLNNIFKIRITNVSNENGVSGVVFPTWSNSNGQDDVRWEQGTYIGNNTWEATINLRNYNIIVDDFITHAYLIDKNGKQVMAQSSFISILQNTSTVYGDFAYPLNFNYQSNPNDPTDWFGPRWGSIHEGIDVPAPSYAQCYAVANGVIEKAGYFMGYGRYVRIRTTDRYGESVSFFYGHLQQINVSVGQTVDKGQLVGLVGGSGYDANNNYIDNAYGPHLHFGAIANADFECVDPEIWIDFHNPYSNVR